MNLQVISCYRFIHVLVGFLLLGTLLGGCQRASYVFQPATGTPRPVAAAPPATPTEPVAAAAAIAALPARHQPAPAVHRAGHRSRAAASGRVARPLLARVARRVAASTAPQRQRQTAAPLAPDPAPEHWRSRGVAFLLAFFLGPFGAHRFYLGYYGHGAAYLGLALLTLLMGILAVVALVAMPVGAAGFSALAVAFLLGAALFGLASEVFLIVDLVRILTGELKPKGGEYYSRFFQTTPDATYDAPAPGTR